MARTPKVYAISLGGLQYVYLRKRLEQWGEGYHQTAKPPMPRIAAKLSDYDIDALASYLSFLPYGRILTMRRVEVLTLPNRGLDVLPGSLCVMKLGAASATVAAVLGVALTILLVPAAAQQGNGEDGAEVFKKCRACHDVGPGAKNKVGPVLNGVMNRKAGTIEGFSCSGVNKGAGEKGLVWTPDVLFKYLENPLTFMPGTKMVFPGLKSEQDRRDVIAYLQRFSP
jgi:cytochrome c